MSASKKYDYIIVGQGLAGSMLAWFLYKAEKTFIIIDELKGETSSTKATGLINPITGRRFVKSWLAEELLPFALACYQNIEKELETSFFIETKIHKILQSVAQQNDWASKTKDERYKKYLSKTDLIHKNKKSINNEFGCVEIAPVYKIDTPKLINVLATFFEEKTFIRREKFEHNKLELSKTGVKYKALEAEKIIFCEGFNLVNNPFFSKVPLFLSKGEVLHFEAKQLAEDFIIGGSTNIVPLGNHLFSVGATYAWGQTTTEKTEEKRQELIQKLETIIKCPYKIVDHKAGIRPTVKDRRPVIGAHPEHKNVLVFNGLGTKGLSLSPFFANQFVAYLVEEQTLNEEVNVARFFS